MNASERSDTRRRWAAAVAVSVLLHLSLLLWWRGVGFLSGDGAAGGSEGGGPGGLGPGASVIEVQIDVGAPVAAGTTVPAADVAVDVSPLPLPAEPETQTGATSAPESLSTSGIAADGTSDAGARAGTGGGAGAAGAGDGSGDGGLPGGAGARTGGGSGGSGGGSVPPRPIEITWPDTRRLAHCVGMRIDVRIRVDAQGRVERVEPASRGLPDDCVRAALETARRIKFAPGTVAGKPAALWSLVTIDFEKKK